MMMPRMDKDMLTGKATPVRKATRKDKVMRRGKETLKAQEAAAEISLAVAQIRVKTLIPIFLEEIRLRDRSEERLQVVTSAVAAALYLLLELLELPGYRFPPVQVLTQK